MIDVVLLVCAIESCDRATLVNGNDEPAVTEPRANALRMACANGALDPHLRFVVEDVPLHRGSSPDGYGVRVHKIQMEQCSVAHHVHL